MLEDVSRIECTLRDAEHHLMSLRIYWKLKQYQTIKQNMLESRPTLVAE